jgi:Kef-type K+ transport system membrane component KefB/nucleotide-binding universal stress UspA family protein
MKEVTLALAILLAAGMLFAELGKRMKLPSVTGYILAGLLLGRSGIDLFGGENIVHNLGHFTQIALMLIAFSIGEQIEIKEIKGYLKSVGIIGLLETTGAFILVMAATLAVVIFFMTMPEGWTLKDSLCLSILLGAVSVATAPAATLHVMKELGAKGPMTTTLMTVVAIDDGLAIMFFSVGMSLVGQLVGAGDAGMLGALSKSMAEILFSIILGIITGIVIDYTIKHLDSKSDMLVAGLAILLLAGESARLIHLSPLLTGMAAGFTVINRDARDVRLFKALHEFGPPVYVLFFTLAGAHLDLSILKSAGLLGIVYFLSRILGKIAGAAIGARLAGAAETVQRYLGLALVPQAGVAIGLIFLIGSEAQLAKFALFITPVVLAGVVLSELTGPVLARYAVQKAGEAHHLEDGDIPDKPDEPPGTICDINGKNRICIAPWDLPPLLPCNADNKGEVIFGASNPVMSKGLARIAIILAQYFNCKPVSVRIFPDMDKDTDPESLRHHFAPEIEEGRHLDRAIGIVPVTGMKVEEGLADTIARHNTQCVILGYPVEGTIQKFQRVVERVAVNANCPVIVTKFKGQFSINRVLVPVTSLQQLDELADVIAAFHMVRGSIITLMYLLPYDSREEDVQPAREKLITWAKDNGITSLVKCLVVLSEARTISIMEESRNHSLILMASARRSQLKNIFFGSLVKAVGQASQKSIVIVNNP